MEKIELPNGLQCYSLNQRETGFIFSEIFSQQQYTRHNIVVHPGDCIFDIGANIGLFVLFMNQMQSDLRIFAFEPIKPIFEVLSGNVRLHNLENVSAFNHGLGSENDAERLFTFFPNMPGNSTEKPAEKTVQKEVMLEAIGQEQVDFFYQSTQTIGEIKTLARVIKDLAIEAIDLLKIDVEGDELAVIQGIEPDDWSKVKQVVAEVHDIDDRLQHFQDLLKTYGFKVETEKTLWYPLQ
jgi:FkbM family methyltransferase